MNALTAREETMRVVPSRPLSAARPVAACRGFTLIELLVVIAVVGILAAIAYPSYTAHVDSTRRADAKAGLMQNAQRLERCYTRNNTYDDCDGLLTESPDGFYEIDNDLDGGTYELVATPQGVQTRDSPRCTTFSLDHRGNRTATGALGNDCW